MARSRNVASTCADILTASKPFLPYVPDQDPQAVRGEHEAVEIAADHRLTRGALVHDGDPDRPQSFGHGQQDGSLGGVGDLGDLGKSSLALDAVAGEEDSGDTHQRDHAEANSLRPHGVPRDVRAVGEAEEHGDEE